MLFGCSQALWKRSCSIVPYQASSDGCFVSLPDPLIALSVVSEVWFDDALNSFFGVVDFFSDSSFSFFGDGFGVALGSTLFFGVGFGVSLAVGFGELFGVGVGLGLGAIVGVGVGDGNWISLLATEAAGGSSIFSISRGVGAGVLFGSMAASLFIQTTVSRFARS